MAEDLFVVVCFWVVMETMDVNQPATELEVPGVGMRGGLGRTLLTAFLVMAIVPLSIVSWYATNRSRLNIQQEVIEKLTSVAVLKETQISRWVEERVAEWTAPTTQTEVAAVLRIANTDAQAARLRLIELADRYNVVDLGLLNSRGEVVQAADETWEGESLPVHNERVSRDEPWVARTRLGDRVGSGVVLIVPLEDGGSWPYLAVCIGPEALTRILGETAGLGQTGGIFLVDQEGMALPQGQQISSALITAALQGQEGDGLYENHAGVPVIGVYHWVPSLGVALLVEQSQEEAFAGNNAVATAVIAATLAVALVTAAIAAFVTRQITQPVVRLTESALYIAAGDLSRRVEAPSRDEIGILAHVFNRMAAELEVLYKELEAKVAQRTELLQRANYVNLRRAIQMQASLEVGQAITSILDPDRLLEKVVWLVKDRFVYSYAVLYTLDAQGKHLRLRASAGQPDPFYGQEVVLAVEGPMGEAFRRGSAVVENRPLPVKVGPPTFYIRSEVALPLRLGERTLGVLDVQSTNREALDQDDVSVLQNVANQITIALENARAYALEREAAERLRELDQSKRQFLVNMSRELRTPLTNIIGFSQLLLKGASGKLTAQQAEDLRIIHHNSQHLLGLIDDLLDVSQIEAGMMELERKELVLPDLIHSVMATTGALVRDGSHLTLREQVPPDLPPVWADPVRIRQVLLRLLTNAVKFTSRGEIRVRAWASDANVYVAVTDTGSGILPEDMGRIFERFEQGGTGNGRRPEGAGLGLALSKEFVEMHGGQMWVESEWGKGSTFTFSLPLPHSIAQQDNRQPVVVGWAEGEQP